MSRFLLVVLFSTVTLVSSAQAQEDAERIRINTQNGEEITGFLKESNPSYITLVVGLGEGERNIAIAYADMATLQRSIGVRRNFAKGARYGAIAAGAGGLLFGLLSSAFAGDDSAGWFFGGFFWGTLGTGFITVPVGLVIGGLIKSEKWESVSIPNQGAASLVPVIGVHPGGRLALGARISF